MCVFEKRSTCQAPPNFLSSGHEKHTQPINRFQLNPNHHLKPTRLLPPLLPRKPLRNRRTEKAVRLDAAPSRRISDIRFRSRSDSGNARHHSRLPGGLRPQSPRFRDGQTQTCLHRSHPSDQHSLQRHHQRTTTRQGHQLPPPRHLPTRPLRRRNDRTLQNATFQDRICAQRVSISSSVFSFIPISITDQVSGIAFRTRLCT